VSLCCAQLRKRYERSVQERNDQGLQLIERNEEVCIFYERINVQGIELNNTLLQVLVISAVQN